MDILATEASTLTIGRLRAEYLLSAEHTSPARIKAQLDTVLTHSLSQMLTMLTARWDAASDTRVLLVRRLTITVDVNTTWERDVVARNWAVQLLHSLEAIRASTHTDENIAWFADRSAYLAHFLQDAADGNAWSKWYYAPFDGLRLLPTSATLRTALCFQPALGRAALLQLNDLAKVLQVLTAQDARRIIEKLDTDAEGKDEESCLQAIWEVWDRAELGPLQVGDEWLNVLKLYLSTVKNYGELAGETLKITARALLRLVRRAISASASTFETILNACTHGDLSALYLTAGSGDAEVMLPLMRCSPDQLRTIGQSLHHRYTDQGLDTTVAISERRYTSFGNLFLLLPILDDLPLEQAADGWPDAGDTSAVALLRLLLLMKCCGQTHAHRVFSDPLVRDLMGVGAALSVGNVAQWARGISPKKRASFLHAISAWQQERDAVDGQTLILGRAALPGSSVAVLLDCSRGMWLDAHGFQQNRSDRLIERLHAQLVQWAQAETLLLSEEMFIEPLRLAYPSLHKEALHSAFTLERAEEDQVLQEVLRRFDQLSSELSYLATPQAFGLSRPLDLALSVAAQNIMRMFAWRLPGFARSSLPYISSNFLSVTASLEDEDERRVVRLGEPPLHFILNLSGMNRSTYRISWLDSRPFALFREE